MSKKLGSSYVVYMGLIPFEWDDAVIKSVVCGTGSVVDVRLGFDYVGKNKGFCFIEYISQSDASRAMLLLEQMKIVNPQTNQIKKIRVELSKESLKVNQDNDFKQPLMLTFNNLPDNVILAREQYVNGPPLPSTNMGLNNNINTTTTNPNLFLPNIPPQLPPVPQYGYNNGYSNNNNNNINNINSNNNHNNNINNNKNNINVINNKLINSTQPQSNSNTLGPEFTNASQRLPPQPETLPFDVLGNINKTLSQIPPVLLIEFISNLKNTLNGPNAGQAVNVLQLSPNLASSTAQALLLMGFIDEQVINEAVTNVQNPRSASHTPVPLPQNILPPPPPQQQQQGYGGYSIPGSNNYGATVPNYPPPPTAVNLNPNWAHFSPSTQSKLAALPSNEADVIVQVLNLPADQISLLPAEQQGIFTNIRAQYLG